MYCTATVKTNKVASAVSLYIHVSALQLHFIYAYSVVYLQGSAGAAWGEFVLSLAAAGLDLPAWCRLHGRHRGVWYSIRQQENHTTSG